MHAISVTRQRRICRHRAFAIQSHRGYSLLLELYRARYMFTLSSWFGLREKNKAAVIYMSISLYS
jgi:hypothetical protein